MAPPLSDAWPDRSTQLDAAALARSAGKNRPAIVLREAAFAVAFSVALVVFLMAVLDISGIR